MCSHWLIFLLPVSPKCRHHEGRAGLQSVPDTRMLGSTCGRSSKPGDRKALWNHGLWGHLKHWPAAPGCPMPGWEGLQEPEGPCVHACTHTWPLLPVHRRTGLQLPACPPGPGRTSLGSLRGGGLACGCSEPGSKAHHRVTSPGGAAWDSVVPGLSQATGPHRPHCPPTRWVRCGLGCSGLRA